MSEIAPVSATGPSNSSEVDVDAFAFNTVLTRVFQEMLKKPDSDDDAEQAQSVSVANEINKPIAAAMAQGVTGFGL